MPFPKVCNFCDTDFLAAKRGAKYCCQSCSAKARIPETVSRNKARRKYPEVPGLTQAQVAYRATQGADTKRDAKLRELVITELGAKCARCGYNADIRGLVMDHKRGDGHQDRKRIGNRIARYYSKHLAEARQNLQVLCATCNQIKAYEEREHNRSRRVVYELSGNAT